MKKFLMIFLVMIILPVSLTFVGCEKKETRKLSDFYTHYLEIADESSYLVVGALPERMSTDRTLSKVGLKFSTELQEKINTPNSVFSKIDEFYNRLLDDALGPVYLYGNLFVTASLSDDEIKDLYHDLDELKDCYLEMAYRVGDLERAQGSEPNPSSSSVPGQTLIKFFSSYEKTIDIATRLSRKISNTYFEQIINNSSALSSVPANSINLNEIASTTKNRLIFYNSIYADIFNQIYIKGKELPLHILQTNSMPNGFVPYDMLKNAAYSDTLTQDLESHRTELIEYGKVMERIQNSIDSEYEKYQRATNSISSFNLITSSSSNFEKANKNIIDKFVAENGIVYESYRTIKAIMDICY